MANLNDVYDLPVAGVDFDLVFEVDYMLKTESFQDWQNKKILVPAKSLSHVIQALFELLGNDFEKMISLKILQTNLKMTDHVLKNAQHYMGGTT